MHMTMKSRNPNQSFGEDNSLFLTETSQLKSFKKGPPLPNIKINGIKNIDTTIGSTAPSASPLGGRGRPFVSKQSTTTAHARQPRSVFARNHRALKTANQSFDETTVHSGMLSTTMSSNYTSRVFPKHQSVRPTHVHDPHSDIRKFIPR